MFESREHEVRVAGGSGQGQNLVFLSFQGHDVDFFDIFRFFQLFFYFSVF